MRSRSKIVTLAVALSALLTAIAVVSARQAPRAAQAPPGSLVIQGGTLIDVRTGALQPNSMIVVEGERITRVGTVGQLQAPAGAVVVDATGKFVMPGLWDSHVHTRDFDGELNINHGVTSSMDMGNVLDWIMALQEAREKGASVGPRIFPQGMAIAGRLGPHEWNVRTPEEAAWAAKQNVAAGVSFLKVYQDATPEMVKAVADVAHANGLNLHGHLRSTNAREAILAGINALAHGTGIAGSTSPPDVDARIKGGRRAAGGAGDPAEAFGSMDDPAKFDDLIKLMIERDVRLEPNFVQLFRGIYPQFDDYQLEIHRLSMNPALYNYIPEMFPRMWATDYGYPVPTAPDLMVRLKKGLENHQLFTRKFAAAGGKLLVGTDSYYHMMSGLSVWQEMELIAAAGVAPLKILQGATVNPAEFVHQDKNLATIEAGKLADVIVLTRNPLTDIKNIRSLETVIQHGRVQELGYHMDYRVVIARPYQTVNSSLPVPHISSVEPSAVPINTKGLVLTVKGRNFSEENRVLWENTDLHVLKFSPTEVTVAVPDELVRTPGTLKVHMITGGRVHEDGENFAEVMVTFGRTFQQRWNGQKRTVEF
jgi:imidazolonepropionase-like amidohydrolase